MQFGLAQRRAIKLGYYADLVLFDAQRSADTATFAAPLQSAAGIRAVFVNGRCARGARMARAAHRTVQRARAAQRASTRLLALIHALIERDVVARGELREMRVLNLERFALLDAIALARRQIGVALR
jgi:hypothetical protein